MSSFEFIDPDGDRLRIEPVPARPSVLLILGTQDEDDTACLRIPLHRVEEVIAGIRDMARQAGAAPGRPVVHISPAPRVEETVRYIVRRGPEGAGA